MRRKVKRPARLGFPLIVKSLSEDASIGIAQASVVDSDEKLAERVTFIHERIGTAAIAEQYIEGRELYVGVLGNERLRVLPIWELEFGNHGAGRRPHRHREAQARPRIPGAPRHQRRAGKGPLAGTAQRASRKSPSASAARSSSTATPASISGYRPTASRTSSKPTPIPRSPRSRSSPPRPVTTDSNIPSCSIASWHWA